MKRISVILSALLLVAVSACTPKENPVTPVEEKLEVTPSSLTFSPDGTQVEQVKVTASGKWTVTVSNSWIQPSPASGSGDATVSVSAAYNASAERNGKMTFKLGSLTREVAVKQSGDTSGEAKDVVPAPAAFDGTKRASTTYQLLIYSFADSDGDGIGDFKGIESKLDYLDEMGVTALWLSPAHPTSSYHAYDVNDYYSLNPLYAVGEHTAEKAEADFKDLIAAAHAKNIQIYMDYVLNHSGKNNAWFKEAVSNASSPYRDYYFISSNPSSDYKKFPMLTGTNYDSGEWKKISGGAPKMKISKTDEAVKSGSSKWNIWLWKEGGNGSAVKFVDNGDGTLYLIVEMNGKYGLLVRPEDNWNAKFGAGSGNPTEGSVYNLVSEGGDMWFTGSGRYRIELTDTNVESLYYMGCFSDWMPDLNYGDVNSAQDNACFKDLAASADKWINMGVDGLRLDAVKHICGGISSYNHASNRVLLKKWYDRINETYKKSHSGNIFMVAEEWDDHGSTEKYYYQSLTSCFEFGFGSLVSAALNDQNGLNLASTVKGFVSDHKAQREDAITSFFLTNHDQNRWADWIGRNVAKEKQAAAILLTVPDKPFIYQGEELGYYGVKDNGDEYVRTPIMWDKAGKDCAKKGVENKVDSKMLTSNISVEAQKADAGSLLNVYQSWSRLRNTYPALAAGEISEHATLNKSNTGAKTIAAWYMTAGSQKLLVIHNVGAQSKSVTISDSLTKPIALLGTASVAGKTLTLGGNSSVVFEL
ncbi:MAG: hypothetical protein IKG92_08455 [Bacteroidales bacterium]|nr:hypothetical protein [Bacteroidales bacterium]